MEFVVIYSAQGSSKSHLQFKLGLIQQITENYDEAKWHQEYLSLTSSPLPIVSRHFIKIVPLTEKKGKSDTTVQSMLFKKKTMTQKEFRKRQGTTVQIVALYCIFNA